MKFSIPFTITNIDRLKKRYRFFKFPKKYKKSSKLQQYLSKIDLDVTESEYLSICYGSFVFSFIILYAISSTILVLTKVSLPFLYSFGIAFVFALFVLFSQMIYPKVFDSRRVRNIEKNLIPALEDMLVQLNSGIPLFNILINISSSDYGNLSEEFKRAVRKINSGFPQIEVLEELSERNSSNFFKRTLWQISNGMRAGSDISIVIEESIKTLAEEQLLQIQNYGNKLNPLIMFYMVISVIIPALSIAFLTIISSMASLPKNLTIMLFISVFIFVIIIQIMFLGIIKSTRPSLL